MKSLKKYLLLFAAAGLLLGSCAPKTPFTQGVREGYKLEDQDLKTIQFYLSNDLVLTRAGNATKEKGTNDGTLIVKSGQSVDQVVLPAGTPGVVVKVLDEKKMAVSFDTGDDTYLVFGNTDSKNGPYTLLAAKWDKNKGELKYGDKVYNIKTSAANTYLLFKIKRLNQYKKEQKVVGGRKL